jgi:DNA-binding transcriptional LysR family regulator
MNTWQTYHAENAYLGGVVNVTWLEVFREVAARGSLTAAAQALGYTQPAVSRQVAALEQATGARLFERLPRGMRLTEEGRFLLAQAEVVLERMQAAREGLEALRNLETGRLRTGAIDSANTALLPRALAAFRAAHPGVRLSVAEGTTPVQLGRLRTGEIDVAVISSYPDRELEGGPFGLNHLLDDPQMVALPAGHRLAARPVLRIADLAGESWVEGHPENAQALADACQRAGFRPRIDFEAREWTAKEGFVAAGLGLALVPALSAGAVFISGRAGIVVRPLHPRDAPVRQIFAATRAGTPAAPVAAFLPCLDAAARDLRAAAPGPGPSAPGR